DALQAMVLEYHAREQAREQEITALRAQRDALKQGQRDDSDKIARLELLLAKLQRLSFGQRSEKLQNQVDLLQLVLEDLYITRAEHAAPAVDSLPRLERQAPVRRPLPEHLPREVLVHVPAETACPDCGGAWKRLGEDVSEMLEFVPASLRVIRHVRPR